MIRVVVLGSGAALPSKKFLPACVAVKYGGVYLFDACEGVQRQMMKYGVSYGKLQAVFLTHLHADHFLGLFGLIQTLNLIGRTQPLQVFGPKGTTRMLSATLGLPWLAPRFKVVVKDVEPGSGEVFKNKLFFVKAFAVDHDTRALGYALEENEKTKFNEKKARARGIHGRLFTQITEKGRVVVGGKTVKLGDVTFKESGKKIVFSGDTRPCAALTRAAKEANLLVHDSCFATDQKDLAKEKAHSTAKQASQTAKKAKAKKLLLTHFSNRYEDDRSILLKEARKVFKNSVSAEEGLEILV